MAASSNVIIRDGLVPRVDRLARIADGEIVVLVLRQAVALAQQYSRIWPSAS